MKKIYKNSFFFIIVHNLDIKQIGIKYFLLTT